jgi:hypothetical protein
MGSMDVRVSAGDDVLRTWTYELAKIDAPLSSNDRVHWAPARKQHADLRWQARTLTVSATGGRRFRKNPFDFELVIHPPDKRVRDSDNYIQHVLKPVKDGIADALRLEDDSDARIGWSIKLGEPTGKRYWRYVITLREREA